MANWWNKPSSQEGLKNPFALERSGLNTCRSLKLPDYRGGEAKTAESEHSPSTREG
jgi:hypothetical protein